MTIISGYDSVLLASYTVTLVVLIGTYHMIAFEC